MINQTLPTGFSTHKQALFGSRLKTAREALGIDRKEIAAQLRLHENMIAMIEHGEYKTDIPMTFIRGYIRGYSKLVGIPEKEVHDAMESMKPKPETNEDETSAFAANLSNGSGAASIANYFPSIDINNVFIHLFTCLLALTLVGLVGVWWHSHKTNPNGQAAASLSIPAETPAPKTENAAPDYSSLAAAEKNATTPTETAAPVIPVKTTTISNQRGKAAFAKLMAINRTTQVLMNLILFLIIITMSMRMYATSTGQASLRRNRVVQNARSMSMPQFNFNFSDMLKGINIQPSFTVIALTTVLLCLLGGGWWYKHTPARVTAYVKQPTIVNTNEQPIDPELLNADFATLKSPATLTAVYMASIKPYVLQDLSYQLDQYIADAAATKFALTDRSTPIGQFNRKKHRKPRATYYQNSYRNNNYPVQQPEYNNGAPPYYSVQ